MSRSKIKIVLYCLLFAVTITSNSIVCEAEEKYTKIENVIISLDNGTIDSNNEDEIVNRKKGRMELFPSKMVAWLLDNLYQRYALNYLKQTKEANIVLYCYMRSIHYAEKCLEFDDDADTFSDKKEMKIKYIQMRYKDIADCDIWDNKVRLRAYEVCQVIG